MALTDVQKAQVRRYLGYPDVNRSVPGSASVEGVMGALSIEGEAFVVELLGQLAAIQSKLTAAHGRQSVAKAEDVTMAGGEEIRVLRAEGSRLVGDLATCLSVSVRRNPFSNVSSTTFLVG